MCLHMYTYIHAYISIYIYAHMRICRAAQLCTRTRVKKLYDGVIVHWSKTCCWYSICTYACTYIHTHIHTCIHVHRSIHRYTSIRLCTCYRIRAFSTYTHTHTFKKTLASSYIHTWHTHTYIRYMTHTYIHYIHDIHDIHWHAEMMARSYLNTIYIHTYIYIYIYIYTHTHTHTHSHTHTHTHSHRRRRAEEPFRHARVTARPRRSVEIIHTRAGKSWVYACTCACTCASNRQAQRNGWS